MTHKSKLDVYIVAAILLALLVFLLGDYWIAGPILLILLLCAYPQSYETTGRGLVVRSALTKVVIPYETIHYVGPSAEESEGSLILTEGRVKVQYGPAGEILLSPANPGVFFSDIERRAPHLVKRGERLVAVFA